MTEKKTPHDGSPSVPTAKRFGMTPVTIISWRHTSKSIQRPGSTMASARIVQPNIILGSIYTTAKHKSDAPVCADGTAGALVWRSASGLMADGR